jgi:uncharacterized protein YdaU (DUF1376 family)
MSKKETQTIGELSVDSRTGQLVYSIANDSKICDYVLTEMELDSMKKIPWYPWYLDDYMSSEKVELLTMEEEGVYRRLLDRAWHRPNTELPLDIEILRRLCKNSPEVVLLNVLNTLFTKTTTGYLNKRLKKEREIAERIYSAKVNGANKRWGKSKNTGTYQKQEDAEHDANHDTEHDANHDAEHDANQHTNHAFCISQPQPQPQPQEPRSKDKGGAKTSAFVLPEWVGPEVWAAFEEMRKKIKKPMTDRARQNIIAKLAEFKSQGHDPTIVLDNSITGSWQDVYEPKNKGAQHAGQQGAGKNNSHGNKSGIRAEAGKYDPKPGEKPASIPD